MCGGGGGGGMEGDGVVVPTILLLFSYNIIYFVCGSKVKLSSLPSIELNSIYSS